MFQFPTGWNSTPQKIETAKKWGCFNSQRDGILRNRDNSTYYLREFQFPTGWNSTKTAPPLKTATNSFNSQRDGILRGNLNFKKRFCYKFQFLTGWNSTSYIRSTNSVVLFQFPTGWNSTKLAPQICDHPSPFQFPTGWNSTQFISYRMNQSDMMFQFPTGWNSTLTPVICGFMMAVSIPNGMEFYFIKE